MSSDPGWWARALGGAPAVPAARAPMPHQPYPQQQQQQYQAPAQQYQAPAQQPVVTEANFMQAAGQWQGGEGVRTETSLCPSCGSSHFFSKAAKASRLPPPAPMCYSCGYNGLFTQADPSSQVVA